MPRTAGPCRRRVVIACAWGALALGAFVPTPLVGSARAEPGPEGNRYVMPGPAPGRSPRAGGAAGVTSGWWLGTTGVVLALALFGAGSVAARRFLPRADAGPTAMRVVGRVNLTPRHSVALLRVGDRTLILGTGPQGPPALLGEWPEPDLAPAAPGLDVRIGDDR